MLKLFTVFDSVAKRYLPPFAMTTTGEAQRGFITMLNDAETEYCRFPADFTLFEMGTFDPATGAVELYEAHQNLGNGAHMKVRTLDRPVNPQQGDNA